MLDTTSEPLIGLDEICKLLPPGRGGRQTHFATVFRWVTRGVRGPGGQLVRLEAVRIGGRWLSSRLAVQRFAESLTPALGDAPGDHPRSPATRQQAAERAAKALEQFGI